MSFHLELVNDPNVQVHRFVPIRFGRAIDGPPDGDGPDIDDRGFSPHSSSPAHGPLIGLMIPRLTVPANLVRVAVFHDRIKKGDKLYPKVHDAAVELVHPKPGNALKNASEGSFRGGCVYLRAAQQKVVTTKLTVHFGSADGPIVAEMGIRTYLPLFVPLQAHVVKIKGVAPTVTQRHLEDVQHSLDQIYAQVGIQFLFRRKKGAKSPIEVRTSSVSKGFDKAGVAVADWDHPFSPKANRILSQNPHPLSLNLFFVQAVKGKSGPLGGFAMSKSWVNKAANKMVRWKKTMPSLFKERKEFQDLPTPTVGAVIGGETDPYKRAFTVAHEIGHILGLGHYDVRIPKRDFVFEVWAIRNVMFNQTGVIDEWTKRNYVGYGYKKLSTGHMYPGAGIGNKKVDGLRECQQGDIVRKEIRKYGYVPVATIPHVFQPKLP